MSLTNHTSSTQFQRVLLVFHQCQVRERESKAEQRQCVNSPYTNTHAHSHRLTGGRGGLPNVGQRAVDRFLGLVPVFPQEDIDNLVPQFWSNKSVLHLPLHNLL